jgi:hypothetical protein
MTDDAISPASVAPTSISHLSLSTRAAEASTRTTEVAAKKDEAVISKDGQNALAKHEGVPSSQQAPAKVLSNSDAALIGQGIQRSNPAHFKSYDSNGDGKLSAQEARAAGLG